MVQVALLLIGVFGSDVSVCAAQIRVLLCISMLLFDIFVLLGVSFWGSQLKGFGMGMLGGSCVLLLMCTSALHPETPPCDIVLYIASIVCAVGAVEAAGGFSYVIRVVELLIRRYPGSMVYISPLLTYMITFFSGTNHIAYSVIPIIAGVSRNIGVRPSYPLSLSVIAALFGTLSSPVSPVALIVEGKFSEYSIGMATIFKVLVCSTLGGLFITAAIFGQISKRYPLSLDKQRCQDDDTLHDASPIGSSGRAISSVVIFFMGIVLVILMSSVKSLQPFYNINGIPQYVPKKYVPVLVMFAVGMVIKVLCRLPYKSLSRGPIFTAGVQGMFSIFGMAWLSSTVVEGNKVHVLQGLSKYVVYPWHFVIVLLLASAIMGSTVATVKAILPLGMVLGIPAKILLATIVATTGVFIIPTYPTILAAVQLDKTGTTRVGRYLFNHSFLLPGLLAIFFAICIGYILVNLWIPD